MMRRSSYNRILVILASLCLFGGGMLLAIQTAYSRYENETFSMVTYQSGAYYGMNDQETMVQPMEPANWILPTEEKPTAQGALEVLQYPSAESALILKVTYPVEEEQTYDQLILAWGEGEFPKGTTYSYDGIHKYQLTEAGCIPATKEAILFIELPKWLMNEHTKENLTGYFQNQEEAICQETIEVTVQSKEASEVLLQGKANPVLGQAGQLNWGITPNLQGITYELELKYLSMNGYGQIPLLDSLQGAIAIDAQGMVTVTVNNATSCPAVAGTYQIVLTQTFQWNGETYPLQTIYIPFFVNYM